MMFAIYLNPHRLFTVAYQITPNLGDATKKLVVLQIKIFGMRSITRRLFGTYFTYKGLVKSQESGQGFVKS